MRVIAFVAIVCGCLFIYGFLLVDRIRIQTRDDRPDFTVVITLPPVTPAYRWVSVYGCLAESDSESRVSCTFDWERESTQEVRQDQRQYLFPWRPVPRGKIQITAMAFDANHTLLASGQTVVIR